MRGFADPRTPEWHARQERLARDAEKRCLELAAWAAGQGSIQDVERWLAKAGGQHLRALSPVLRRLRAAEAVFEEVRARHLATLRGFAEDIGRYTKRQARAQRLTLVEIPVGRVLGEAKH